MARRLLLFPKLIHDGLVLASLLVFVALPSLASTTISTNVSARANIWGAGHNQPAAPAGGGAGLLPTEIGIPIDCDGTVRFRNVTGSIDFGTVIPSNGPEGILGVGLTQAGALDGIGGVQVDRIRFLAGVFVTDVEPTDPAPSPFAIPDTQFASLAPALNQSFFIGDGLTGTGTGLEQLFQIPTGATRLFLGFHDGSGGIVGFYGDNSGSIAVDAFFVPEPNTAILLGIGLGWVARRRPRASAPSRRRSVAD